MKQHIGTIAQVVLGVGCFAALRWFGVPYGYLNIPAPWGTWSISPDTLQVVFSGLASGSPAIAEKILSQQWFEDAVAMPTRVKELHAVKAQLVAGAASANALGLTGTVKPVEAEKPAT